jgi:glycosyltransferase involved in cell wall biosynthesis
MSNEKTFVILTPGFPESEADTTCLPLQQQFVKSLKRQYPALNIIVLSFQYPYHKNLYKWFGIRVIPFGGRNKGGLQKLMLRRKINSVLKELNSQNKLFGLLSFWYNECALVGKKFGDKYGISHYCWILGQDARKENKYPRIIPPRPQELIALSDFVQNEFEKNHGIRPHNMVPPGIDEQLFERPSGKKDIDLLGVGSLIPLKQYDIFLEVVAGVKDQFSQIKGVLVGKGNEKEKLKSLISKQKLENNVTLTGELPYHEVLLTMQKAKVFLHPASYEGFGVVCLEALYSGAHVISFCKPMNTTITNWHIAKDKNEMIALAANILRDQKTESKPVKVFTIDDTTTAIMKQFGER